MDPVGGPFAEKISQSLRDSGTLIVYSSMGGVTSEVGIPDLLYRDVRVCQPPQLAAFTQRVTWLALLQGPMPYTYNS